MVVYINLKGNNMKYNVTGFDNHQMVVALSTKITEAIVHLHYDQIDEKNHKSLNTLVHVLEDSGMHDIAKIVADQKPYAVLDNPQMALNLNNFINEHSAAISSSLYYKGVRNNEADALIHKEFPPAKEENLTSHRHFKLK
jgi:hypothetical protein